MRWLLVETSYYNLQKGISTTNQILTMPIFPNGSGIKNEKNRPRPWIEIVPQKNKVNSAQ